MKSPKILLIGIGGVYNYGCEAIVRGTEIIVRSEYPDANIVYASHRVTDDRKMLEGSHVQVIERGRFRRYSLKNICRKLLALAGIKWCPMVDSLGLVEGVDAVFSKQEKGLQAKAYNPLFYWCPRLESNQRLQD